MIGLPYYCLYPPPLLYDTNIPGDATEPDVSPFGRPGLYVISMDSRFLMRVMW